jgi:hypothetical protein
MYPGMAHPVVNTGAANTDDLQRAVYRQKPGPFLTLLTEEIYHYCAASHEAIDGVVVHFASERWLECLWGGAVGKQRIFLALHTSFAYEGSQVRTETLLTSDAPRRFGPGMMNAIMW